MSTSDSRKDAPRFPGEAFETVLPGERFGVPAGVPDPAVLARMANEFFTALPELSQAEQSAPTVPQLSAAVPGAAGALNASGNPAALTSWPTTGIPSEAELRAVPASQAPAAPPSLVAGLLPQALPEIPRGAGATSLSALPSFSFLDEIRPLFSYPIRSPLAAAPPLPAVKIPGETELRALANNFSRTATPQILDSGSYLGAPQVPAAAPQVGAVDKPVSFAFLDELRHLAPAGTLPAAEPWRVTAAVLPELNISSGPFDVQAIRRDFPIFEERVHGKPLIWLDNAATTQKPQSVIDRLSHFYTHENSNIHRAAHELAARATDAYEAAREKVRRFLNASTVREIIFVRGTTEAINLAAQSWGRQNIQKDDEIVITWLEHHANIVPWQMLCAEKGARLRVAPVDNSGQVLLDEYQKLLGPRTRLVAFAQVSNALGTVTPAREMIEMAHRYGAKVLLDGAQAVSHMRTDVQLYDCDFYVLSGHKMFGPTGIGVVYGKLDILENTQPWHGGGNMIQDVTFEKTTYQPPPGRFEAGTGNIADAVGLGAAIDYIERIGMHNIARYEHDLLVYATEALERVPGLRLIGTAMEKAGVLSFVLDGFRTEDVGAALNRQGIAVRAGHHCAQPILRRFGVESTVRPSLALYNTCEEIDALVNALWNLKQGHGSL
ncbi:MAG TPA: family 2A encapsulin nanocompartment cargo protein cysteine desulfurase [Candidatus Cybelea sp.]|jgi:cysteine desulfurase/selenocysteine lyase|nr:family 2A encapsulin nanocompartment cargo protein cysteine desulfurase [Candidatus Cybelea sp.]